MIELLLALLLGVTPVEDSKAGAPLANGAVELAPGVWSGRAPDAELSLDDLAALGFRAVLSVDGLASAPEGNGPAGVTLAHVPLGYDGIHGDERLRIAKAVRDLPRPLYVHCHHGIHRGPAAAAFGLIAIGELNNEQGVRILEAAGTAYAGLTRAVEIAGAFEPESIDGTPMPPPVAEVGGMQASMAEIDRVWAHIRDCAEAGWAVPDDHPDLVAELEAAKLENLFRALARDPETPRQMKRRMEQAAELAARFEGTIGRMDGEPYRGLSDPRDGVWFDLEQSCNECHARFRD